MTTSDAKLPGSSPRPPFLHGFTNFTYSRGGGSPKPHGGAIDYAVPVGTVVAATYTGKVVYAQVHAPKDPTQAYGGLVVLEHEVKCNDGKPKYFYTYYAHLSQITVAVGNNISAGSQLGLSGGAKGAPGSGFSTGPHVHYEERYTISRSSHSAG